MARVFFVTPKRISSFGLPPSIIQVTTVPSASFDVDVEPGVWVDHLPLHQGALQAERLVDVEFGREGVMRAYRCDREQDTGTGDDTRELRSHWRSS